MASTKMMTEETSRLLIKLDEPIDVKQTFGEGCYGKVHQVKYNGATCIAKMLHDILRDMPIGVPDGTPQKNETVARFHQECLVLSRMRHPNVVQFIGIYQPTDNITDIALVMELLHTDMKHFIENHKTLLAAPIKQRSDVFTDSNDFYLPLKLSIIHDIICGLLHIHSHNVLHRDLNAGNVLLTRNLQAKVADLGVARTVSQTFSQTGNLTVCPGAPDCMPPEALLDNPTYDSSLDVFSLGHLMLYLISCRYPTPRDLVLEADGVISTLKRGSLTLSYQAHKRIESLNRIHDDHCTSASIIKCLSDTSSARPLLEDLEKEYAKMCIKYPKSHNMIYMLENGKSISLEEEVEMLRTEKSKITEASIRERRVASERDRELVQTKERLEQLEKEHHETVIALEASEAKLGKFVDLIKVNVPQDTSNISEVQHLSKQESTESATEKPLTDMERYYYEETIKGLRNQMEKTKMENEELIEERGARMRPRSSTTGATPFNGSSSHGKKKGLASKIHYVKKRMASGRRDPSSTDAHKKDSEVTQNDDKGGDSKESP